MNRQVRKMTSAAKEWMKSFGVPAAIVAAWVAAVALLATQVASPLPLEMAIEDVLAAPATQTAQVHLPTVSQPMGIHS